MKNDIKRNPEPNKPNIFRLIPFIIIMLLLLGTLLYLSNTNRSTAPSPSNLLKTKILIHTAPSTDLEKIDSIKTQ